MAASRSVSAYPATQSLQEVATASAKRPSSQAAHSVAAVLSVSAKPASHSLHTTELPGENLPLQTAAALCGQSWPGQTRQAGTHASQLVHAVAASASRSAWPAAQEPHSTCSASAKVPSAQFSHGVDGSASESARPAGQPMHSTLAISAKKPVAHSAQDVEAREYVPAGQSVQVEAASAEYLPSAHTVQGVLGSSSSSASPVAHSVQAVAPPGVNVPAAQGAHGPLSGPVKLALHVQADREKLPASDLSFEDS